MFEFFDERGINFLLVKKTEETVMKKNHRMSSFLFFVVLVFGASVHSISADDKIEPVLEVDSEAMAILEKLGDQSSAVLPPFKTVGEWNDLTRMFNLHTLGPKGRDFTIKAVWMPDRKRAFFCGANHGAPHRFNDAWEYDLAANTWVMLFVPTHNSSYSSIGPMEIVEGDVKDANGQVVEKVKYVQAPRGAPANLGHTWWGLAYDPNMKAALWMNAPIGISQREHMKKMEVENPYGGPPLWAFYPEKRKWELILTPAPYPKSGIGAMEYVPELGGAFWYSNNWFSDGMWVYQPKTNEWKNLKPNGGKSLQGQKSEVPHPEAVMTYDTDNKIAVAVLNGKTYHYDVAANTWTKTVDKASDDLSVPWAHDYVTPFGYDPINKVCLLYSRGHRKYGDKPTGSEMWAYSTTTKTWTKLEIKGPEQKTQGGSVIGYFDPERNVFVVSGNEGTVWVYRYKQAAK